MKEKIHFKDLDLYLKIPVVLFWLKICILGIAVCFVLFYLFLGLLGVGS